MSAPRPRLSTAIALLSSTALLVVGMDTLTYASTGDSLLLGKVNEAGKPTVVSNSGRGAALELRNGKKYPPLKVTSARKVVRLNVDRVDGVDSRQLEPGSVTYTIGAAGDPGDDTLYVAELKPGRYLTQMYAFYTGPGKPICYVVDYDRVVDSMESDFTGSLAQQSDDVITASGVIKVRKKHPTIVGCDANAEETLLAPLQFTFRKIVKEQVVTDPEPFAPAPDALTE